MDAIYEHIFARIALGLYANYANARIGSCSLFDVSYSVHYFGDVNYSRFKSGAGKRPMERTLPPSGIQAEHFVFPPKNESESAFGGESVHRTSRPRLERQNE